MQARRIGIFLPNWVGDVIMATPTLRALRRHFPSAHLLGVMRPYLADVLAGTTWLDEQLFWNTRADDPTLRTWSLVKQLRRRQLDAIVMMTNSLRTAAVAWAAGAPQRIGYVRNGRGWLLTHKLYAPRHRRSYLPTPAIDSFLQLAYAVGCPPQSPVLELDSAPPEESAADAVWAKLKLPEGQRVVVFNSGGAYGAAKQWPSEHFATLARRIVARDDMAVLVVCGPAERAIAREIVRGANHPRVVSLAEEQVSLGLTKACIRRSRLLVTTDSGPRFLGVAYGIPTIALFGPTHIAWSRTAADNEVCLQHEVPCGPCMRRTCPLGHHECMQRLTPERVYAEVAAKLDQARVIRAA